MNGNSIGKFCSVAKPGTIIMPKNIPGYITPEGQVLESDGQRFTFIYTPIQYKITYNLNGGSCEGMKESYTIEDPDYVPTSPVKKDYTFIGWEPASIPHGSIGDVEFTAKWKPNAILLSGSKLKKALKKVATNLESIMAIKPAAQLAEGDYVNISSTDTPILATFDAGTIYVFSESQIYCNMSMVNAFSGLTILRDISALSTWVCKPQTNINSIFKDCALLSDVSAVEMWANGEFKDFTDAFSGTAALEAGRVPAWYKWNVKINYMSTNGTIFEIVQEDRIPGEVIYPKAFSGYKAITTSITISDPSIEYTFEYEPIPYEIKYETRGGELAEAKTSYTIEDETYYPPEPVKYGYSFAGWEPQCINKGEYGNVTFIANYTKLSEG